MSTPRSGRSSSARSARSSADGARAKSAAPLTLRDAQGDAVRARLLESALALIEEGTEPTMRAVAARAGTSERTIYRYFESHEVLVEALAPLFVGKSGVALCGTFAELPEYARALFDTFAANHKLTVALLTSSWAGPHMRVTRRKNLDALRALVDEAHPRAPERDRAAAASSLRAILSGAGWNYLRNSCGLAQAEVVAHAQWLVATVDHALRSAARR
jgi:AcrR family transcriptional regulator